MSDASLSEEWRSVLGYEGYYEVSNCGRVRSCTREISRRHQPSVLLRGKVLRLAKSTEGRDVVNLWRGGKKRQGRVSVLVLEAFVGPRPDGMWALHNDDDRTNNNLRNLRWGTPAENTQDAILHGTHVSSRLARRERCPRGHLLLAPNLVRNKAAKGWRQCLACQRACSQYHNRYRHRRAPFDFEGVANEYYERIMVAGSAVA